MGTLSLVCRVELHSGRSIHGRWSVGGGKSPTLFTSNSPRHTEPRGCASVPSLEMPSLSLLVYLRNAYGLFWRRTHDVARVKAVELRQKNRDELLAEIENYKKELAQVIRPTPLIRVAACGASDRRSSRETRPD